MGVNLPLMLTEDWCVVEKLALFRRFVFNWKSNKQWHFWLHECNEYVGPRFWCWRAFHKIGPHWSISRQASRRTSAWWSVVMSSWWVFLILKIIYNIILVFNAWFCILMLWLAHELWYCPNLIWLTGCLAGLLPNGIWSYFYGMVLNSVQCANVP